MRRLTIVDLACWIVFLVTALPGVVCGLLSSFVCLVIAFAMMCVAYWGMYVIAIVFLYLPNRYRLPGETTPAVPQWRLYEIVVHVAVVVLWVVWVVSLGVVSVHIAVVAARYIAEIGVIGHLAVAVCLW
jgi:hypothetical protein